jgi:hypothetical protein
VREIEKIAVVDARRKLQPNAGQKFVDIRDAHEAKDQSGEGAGIAEFPL